MRTVHKATAVIIATALTLSVSACGGTAKPGAQATTSAGAATTTATPTVNPTAIPVKTGPAAPSINNPLGIDWAKQTPFTGPATTKFGATNVMAAYREALEFSLVQGYTNLMAKGYEAKPIEFSLMKPYMTPATQKLWDLRVKTALAQPKNQQALFEVFAITNWNLLMGSPYNFRKGQVLYTLGRDFSPATTTVQTTGGVDYLVLHFTVSRKVRVMQDGKAVLLVVKKDITYWMVPNGLKNIPWLIDRWSVNMDAFGKTTTDPIGPTA